MYLQLRDYVAVLGFRGWRGLKIDAVCLVLSLRVEFEALGLGKNPQLAP